MSENAAEAARILGIQDRIVGVSDYILKRQSFWPELSNKPCIGRWGEPNYEVIASLKPDAVFMYSSSPGPEAEKRLSAFGIPVFRFDFYKIPALPGDMLQLGKMTGREAQAQEFGDWYQRHVDQIRLMAHKDPVRPKILMEGYSEFRVWGPGSGAQAMMDYVNARNIGEVCGRSTAIVSSEWVVEQDPEFIIKTPSVHDSYEAASSEKLAKIRSKIMSRPGWGRIQAVKTGRVVALGSDLIAGPGEVVGLAYLAKILHPATCAGLNPAAIHREYLERFQRIPYRGFYVFPE